MNKNGFSDKINKYLLLSILCIFSVQHLFGQNVHTGSVVFDKDGFSFDICVIYEKTEIKTTPNVSYFWYRNGELKSTMGDYSGNLLHGKYEKFDDLGNLRSKGNFQYGLKNGTWKYWNSQGFIDTEEIWKKGFLLERISFDGDVITTQNFRNNLLHGKETKQKDNELISSVKYKNGEVLKKKDFKLFSWLKKSFRKNKNKENDAEKMQTNSMEN